MKVINSKKSNFVKKIFIKICRMLGYELIDQETLEFPVSNKKSEDSLSVPGEKSISLGVGEFTISRKVQSIDIIVKTCTSVQLVTQSKNRIFEKEKYEYTFRTLRSLHKSALDLKKKFPKILIQFTIIDISSNETNKKKLSTFFNDFPLKFVDLDKKKINIEPITIDKNNKTIENNMATTMKSIYESFEQAQKCNYNMKIVVSTDSNEYANIAKKYGAEVPFLRPNNISGDLSSDFEFIDHCVKWLKTNENYTCDIILQLRPTSPTRKIEDINKALQLFINNRNKFDSL